MTAVAGADGERAAGRAWWGARRAAYNVALAAAGVAAFAAYLAALGVRCAGVPGVEVTLFTTAFQGVAYLVAMGLANLCYGLGPWSERFVAPAARPRYRRRAFAAGLALSVALPFLVPLAIYRYGCGPGEYDPAPNVALQPTERPASG